MSPLRRRLTLYGLTMVAVGSCIGAGIFITPSQVVEDLPHAGWVLVVWVLGGLVALTGALTFAELGGMFPKAGGVYVYLREAYGELTGFLYGWVTLLVVNTGSLAALGITFAEYLTFFFPLTASTKVLVAAAAIALLTFLNVRGVDTSQRLINLFTALKLVAMLLIVFAAVLLVPAESEPVIWSLSEQAPPYLPSALLIALVGVLWSFGGWHHASYLAGEAIEPQRTVPRAMFLGALVVTVTYVLVNAAYLSLLPIEKIADTERVAGDAVEAILPGGGRWVALAISLSVFGTMAIYTMSAPRIYFAMARDGLFFPRLARVHEHYQTPANAMLIQSGWAMLLLFFWGTFENLITYVTFIDLAFMGLAGAGVFLFRRRLPLADRPYRVWGYPIVPLLFVGITAAFVLNTLFERPVQAVAGLLVLGIGVAVYGRLRRR